MPTLKMMKTIIWPLGDGLFINSHKPDIYAAMILRVTVCNTYLNISNSKKKLSVILNIWIVALMGFFSVFS